RMGMNSIAVQSSAPDADLLATVDKLIAPADVAHLPHIQGQHIEIPTRFDADDLSAIAQLLGLSTAEFIDEFTDIDWRVELIGFAPGFPYLKPVQETTWLDAIGRLDTPRTRVPAGSVAIAAGMAAIYPSAMPGGWNLLGRTELVMFDAVSEQPSLLNVGDTVRFVEASS
ncbi:MAG: hypothetical protein RL441_139, partial [Actinomycetota bacterium]